MPISLCPGQTFIANYAHSFKDLILVLCNQVLRKLDHHFLYLPLFISSECTSIRNRVFI